MGLLSWLGWGAVPLEQVGRPLEIAAWDAGPNSMVPVVLTDIFGDDTIELPLTRSEAMTVPAVAAAHLTLVSSFGNLELRASGGAADGAGGQPRWLTMTDKGAQPAYLRNARTIIDFLYIGFSLWQCTRGTGGMPTAAWHVPFGRWEFDDQGTILIDGEVVDADEVIFFESLVPGLLNVATRTLRTAVEIEKTIAERARVSVPTTLLKNTTDTELEDDEVSELLAQYRTLRASRDGSTVGYVPSGLDLSILEDPASAWLLEARNAVVTDVAKHTGIPSAQLEGTSSIDSLTYATVAGQLALLLKQTSKLYLDPIEARLSMSDVTPNGQVVRFDKSPLDEMLESASATDPAESAAPTAPAAPAAPAPAQPEPEASNA